MSREKGLINLYHGEFMSEEKGAIDIRARRNVCQMKRDMLTWNFGK